MARSALPTIEPPSIEGWPAPTAVWQHAGQSGQFQVRIDLVRGAGRRDAVPDVTLAYETGGGNGAFGLGWSLNLPTIHRGNGRHLPRYRDAGPEADAFMATDFGELVPVLTQRGDRWQSEPRRVDGHEAIRYRPRGESAFPRIERRTDPTTGDVYWVTISRENVTRVFGRTRDARIADPADATRIAHWLLEDEWDSRGHRIHFEYKREDLTGVEVPSLSERQRLAAGQPEALLHIKRIQWGNARPFEAGEWLFELVFDYGEHEADNPTPEGHATWTLRPDAFSSYRAGFEMRTRHRCQRVLLFQHLDPTPSLVRAHELSYESTPALSLLTGITLKSYRRDTEGVLRSEALPTTRFEYSTTQPHGPVREVTSVDSTTGARSLASAQQWLDLDGTALPGLVSREASGTLYYRPNLGDGRLGSPVVLPTRPSLTDTAVPLAQSLGQPFGDSRSCLVDLAMGPGYQERARTGSWLPYTPFPEAPTMRANAVGARSLDLDGDGRADLLLTGEFGPRWHPFAGREGWQPARDAVTAPSAQTALADRTGTVLLADMNGDGLADFVQVRPGSVRYWPNLGYGRFGEPVQMAGSPMLDGPDLFDPARVRLVDIDGSGPADLVYLGRQSVTWYPNRAGNSFGAPQVVRGLPAVTDLDGIDVVDLLGTGTGCLVWSSVAPGRVDRPVRYIELVGGQRPHLLTTVVNGHGMEVEIDYTPSTRLMLNDRAAGRPWHSTLAFPLWVVTEVRELDLASEVTQVSTWSYRHGYYDDVARELRGFASVVRRDTQLVSDDPVDLALTPPVPVRETRSWYHTGAFLDREPLAARLAAEFFAGDPDHPAQPGLAIENPIGIAPRELLRALQGKPIREEVYEASTRDTSSNPYTVVEHGYLVRALQPASPTMPPAVAVFPREVVERTYERSMDDPRVQHRLTLAVDAFGNATRQATISYPRRNPEHPEQARPLATLEEREVLNRDDALEWYRAGVPMAQRLFELGPLPPLHAGELYRVEDVGRWLIAPSFVELPFEQSLSAIGSLQRRLVNAVDIRYWNDTLTGVAAPDNIGRLALVHHQRQAALTPGLLTAVYGAGTLDPPRFETVGYELDHDLWWARGSQITYDRDAFYQPVAERTPRGADYTVTYDRRQLFVAETRDPLGNVQRAEYDSQALAARLITDPNDATVSVAFDALGLPVAVAMAGARGEGDSLTAPTIEVARDVHAWQHDGTPVALRVAQRARHSDPASLWERAVTYFDGRGRPLQRKRLAEPAAGDSAPRWVVESHVVATTASSPLRSYAPGFTTDDRFSPETALAPFPLTRTRLDALDRAIETRRPDGALARSAQTAWRTTQWDANDAVRDSDWFRRRRRPDATPRETAEAGAAEGHAGTPSVDHLDPSGRVFLHIDNGGTAGLAATRTTFDISGQVTAVTDPRGIVTEQRTYDMLGQAIRVRSTASGETRVLYDAEGEPVHAWGARGQEQRLFRDRGGRLTRREVRPRDGAWRVAERLVWGEYAPEVGNYLKSRLYLHYDGAGQFKTPTYDFHGNPVQTERTFRADLTVSADWSSLRDAERSEDVERAAASVLSRELPFVTRAAYDAQDRLVERTTPDSSVTNVDYGLRGLQESIRVTMDGRTTEVLQAPVYDAAGRRQSVRLGNGVRETSAYDDATGFLAGRATIAPNGNVLRDLGLSYDAVGNVLAVTDAGQQTRYFRNAAVSPDRTFSYDALYRLTNAEGREAAVPVPSPDQRFEPPIQSVPHENDLAAVRRYREHYVYDLSGNLIQLKHEANSGGNWTIRYDIDSAADRITGLWRDGTIIPSPFIYDDAGNATTLGGLKGLVWNDDEQLTQVDLEGGGIACYVYDAGGRRAAKVIVRLGEGREERLYLDGFERYQRTTPTGAVIEETETLHVPDGEGRLLLIERRRAAGDRDWTTWWRYQHADQVGSCWLETDQAVWVLAFEEFRPYGSTAYHAAQPVQLPKRYRFGGQEHDSETGLILYGVRYYAPWLGRWVSADPAGMVDGTNRYAYCRNNPTTFSDPTGTQSVRNFGPGLDVPIEYLRPGFHVHYSSRRDASGLTIQSVSVYAPGSEWNTPPVYRVASESYTTSSHRLHHQSGSSSRPSRHASPRSSRPPRAASQSQTDHTAPHMMRPAQSASSSTVQVGPATPITLPPSSRSPDLSNPIEAERYAVQTARNDPPASTAREGSAPSAANIAGQVAVGFGRAAHRRLPTPGDVNAMIAGSMLIPGPFGSAVGSAVYRGLRTAIDIAQSVRQRGVVDTGVQLLPPVQVYESGSRALDALDMWDYATATEAAIDSTEAAVNTYFMARGVARGVARGAQHTRLRIAAALDERDHWARNTPPSRRPQVQGSPVDIEPPPAGNVEGNRLSLVPGTLESYRWNDSWIQRRAEGYARAVPEGSSPASAVAYNPITGTFHPAVNPPNTSILPSVVANDPILRANVDLFNARMRLLDPSLGSSPYRHDIHGVAGSHAENIAIASAREATRQAAERSPRMLNSVTARWPITVHVTNTIPYTRNSVSLGNPTMRNNGLAPGVLSLRLYTPNPRYGTPMPRCVNCRHSTSRVPGVRFTLALIRAEAAYLAEQMSEAPEIFRLHWSLFGTP